MAGVIGQLEINANFDDLKNAILEGYKLRTLQLLEQPHINVRSVNAAGETVLHFVLRSDQLSFSSDIIDFLDIFISRGVDPNVANIRHETPLHLAIKKCNTDVMEYLIRRNARIDSKILDYVLKNADRCIKSMILLLKESGAEFNGLTYRGDNLLHALAEKTFNADDVEVLFDLFVEEGCDVNLCNKEGRTPLHVAVESDNVAVIRKLVAHYDTDVNCKNPVASGKTPLYAAIAKRDHSMEIIELLLDNNRADVNCKTRTHDRPLSLAISLNKLKIIDILLKYKAEVNAHVHSNSILVGALIYETTDSHKIVRNLLDYGADINDNCVISLIRQRHGGYSEDLVLRHWIKLRTANLPCSSKYQPLITKPNHLRLRETCLREVDQLKNYNIDSCTSLYQWLHMNPDRRYVHTQNEKLRSLVDSPELIEKFPAYSTVILGHYRETEAKRRYLQLAKKAFVKIIRFYLPDICLERIFSHLNTGYLLEFIEVAEEI